MGPFCSFPLVVVGSFESFMVVCRLTLSAWRNHRAHLVRIVVTAGLVFGNFLIFLVVGPSNKSSHVLMDTSLFLPILLGWRWPCHQTCFLPLFISNNKIPCYLSLCTSTRVLSFICCRCSSCSSSALLPLNPKGNVEHVFCCHIVAHSLSFFRDGLATIHMHRGSAIFL